MHNFYSIMAIHTLYVVVSVTEFGEELLSFIVVELYLAHDHLSYAFVPAKHFFQEELNNYISRVFSEHTTLHLVLRSSCASASTKYFHCLIPVSITTRSTIHFTLIASENVGCSSS